MPRWAWAAAPALARNPFALGIASGDPAPDGVVLWTRLAVPEGTGALTVRWEIADDPAFRRIVQAGQAGALPALAHSVHVEVAGLASGRWYCYRFMLGDAVSATGRTRTAPAANAPDARLRLAFASCQRWEHGYYAAWRHLAADAPDLVAFLGDYIYEYATPADSTGLARTHALRHARTLDDYRDRYALHKSDPDLQAAHRACAWIVTWDDHEVENDYADDAGRDAQGFAARRAAGYQAFYEHMPLRAAALAAGMDHLRLYRSVAWGRLARFHLLDDRQYRARQACRPPGASGAASVKAGCAELQAPERSLLGLEQERWLDGALARDAEEGAARWSVIAQQTLFSPRHYPSGVTATDNWDGYPAARARLLASVRQRQPRNTVLIGGDIHQNYVCAVHADPERPGSPVLASEFCGTSITSRSGTTQAKVDAVVRRNPHVLLADCEHRGYVLADIAPQRWSTQLRVLDDAARADASISTLARFVVEDGLPGPMRDGA
ncbi:alkaline phosphatase D family protein [Ramlibacter sp. H39-3-26]|nr:alkaline phosphatase D family protein [Ramlibacter sp. H39-3-26]MDF1484294.1 alkaline phosphatase D family protein [Ramlibacter sp. H39-3-26]